MHIRIAASQDRDSIRGIYSAAFPKGESEAVAKLAIDLLSEDTAPQTISLIAVIAVIAVIDDTVVGHVAFSPVGVENNENCRAYILAPLAVYPGYQNRRIGSTLVEYGMRQLSAMGVNVAFVYGDPEYYGRFGFNADTARDYKAPYSLKYPFGWQAVVLNEYSMKAGPAVIRCVSSLCDPGLW